jgi:hypothetical protein
MSSRKRTPSKESTVASTDTGTAVAEPAVVADAPAAANDNAQAANDNKPSFAERVGQRKFMAAPDPFGIAGDYQAGVRLFESKQDRQMAIKFEKKPPQAVIDKMHEARWIWKPEDQIWAYPVRPGSAMSTRIDAERLYQDVRQMIRKEMGIESGQEIPF